MGKCEGKHGHELPCFGRGDCDTPGCYRNRRINCGLGDGTWKERHAKGVPVKMTTSDFFTCMRSSARISGLDRNIDSAGNPLVVCVDWQYSRIATFCNFRYKPEWLERPDKHCAKGNCIGDGSCYHCGCAYRRETQKQTI